MIWYGTETSEHHNLMSVFATVRNRRGKGNDDGKFFSLNVGSGLTDENREKFWQHKDSLIGQLIEIRADAVTQSMEGENYSLRFPRFKTFRGFEPGEKV